MTGQAESAGDEVEAGPGPQSAHRGSPGQPGGRVRRHRRPAHRGQRRGDHRHRPARGRGLPGQELRRGRWEHERGLGLRGFGIEDLEDILGQFSTAGGAAGGEDPLDPADDPDATAVEFVSFVLDDVQGFWDGHFAEAGQNYPEADLVLFRDGVQSGCGFASSVTGPFCCPTDSKVGDLAFFR